MKKKEKKQEKEIKHTSTNSNETVKKVLISILTVLLVVVAVFSGYQIYSIISVYQESDEEYAGLADTAVSTIVVTDGDSEEEEAETTEYLSVDHEYLESVNSDYVGWIYMEGSNINYPVVRGSDNQKYTYTSFELKYNNCGAIFFDYRNSDGWDDFHIIIYGHKVRWGTMFASLLSYTTESYWDEHQYFQIYAEGEVRIYQVFSFFLTDATSDVYTISFSNDVEKAVYIEMLQDNSMYESDVDVRVDDYIITLSTCAKSTGLERYVLNAVLVETIALEE